MSYPPPMQDPQQPNDPGYYAQPPGGAAPGSGLAIGSMVCGILSIVCCIAWYLSAPLGIVALSLGLVAKGKIRRGMASGAGMATAGVVCGSIGLVLAAVSIGFVIWAVATGHTTTMYNFRNRP